MSRPRILIVSRRFWPQVGATERALGRLVWGLGERLDITVVTAFAHPNWPRRLDYGPARIERIYKTPVGWFSMRGAMRTLGRYIADSQPSFDLVYVLRLREEAAAVIKAVGEQLPVVLRAEYSGPRGDCCRLIERRGGETIRRQCAKATRIIATSPSVADETAAAGMPRSRIVEISCDAYSPDMKPDRPTDVTEIGPDNTPSERSGEEPTDSIARRRRIRERARGAMAEIDPQLQTPDNTRVVTCIEQWQDPEIFDFLLETALTMAAGPGRPVRFWLIGDRPLAPWIIRRMTEGEVRSLFAFVPIVDDVGPLLDASDAVIVPSCDRFSPLPLIEAIESQTPTVCIDRPEIHAVIGGPESENTRLFPEGDIRAARSALERLIDDTEAADAIAQSASRYAANRFGVARNIDRHATLLQELIDINTKTD